MGKLARPNMVAESVGVLVALLMFLFWVSFTVYKSELTLLFLNHKDVKDKGMSLRDLDVSSANYSVCSCLPSHCVLYVYRHVQELHVHVLYKSCW